MGIFDFAELVFFFDFLQYRHTETVRGNAQSFFWRLSTIFEYFSMFKGIFFIIFLFGVGSDYFSEPEPI